MLTHSDTMCVQRCLSVSGCVDVCVCVCVCVDVILGVSMGVCARMFASVEMCGDVCLNGVISQ